MQTAALNSLTRTGATLERPSRATMALAPVAFGRSAIERERSSLRTMLRDLRDTLLMAVGRDDDDDDYECAHG